MKIPQVGKWPALAALLFCAIAINENSTAQHSPVSARSAFSHTLPTLDGSKLAINIVEVSYALGGASSPHSHPCPVTGYVLEGAVRMQVKGEAEAIYKPGQTFYEAPNGVHQVSANASQTEPAKFLAIFVCDHQAPLSSPVGPPK